MPEKTSQRTKRAWEEYVRFAITGILNTCTDFAVMNALLAAAGGSRGGLYTLFKAVSFLTAVVQSYFLNKYWVFESKDKASRSEGQRFFAVSFFGFLLNIASSSVAFEALDRIRGTSAALSANIAAAIGTALVLAWNYAGYKFFVFITPINTPTTYERITKKDA